MILFGILALVGAGYAGYYAYRADDQAAANVDLERRTPFPGARDQFALSTATLNGAPVPRWK